MDFETPKLSMTEGNPFLSMPFVVRKKIVSQLTLKEQLILREVCPTTKEWIDKSSLLENHIPVTCIKDHGRKTFSNFLQKRPPHLLTGLFIENNTSDFLLDPSLPKFLQMYSPLIKRLKVNRFFICNLKEEFYFYENFTNLEELELCQISICSSVQVVPNFPQSFKNLKCLKIGTVTAFPQPPEDLFGAALIPLGHQRTMGKYVWDLISFCENLTFLGYPKTSRYFFQAFVDGRGRGEFGVFCDYVRNRQLNNPQGCNLKFCDFYNDNWAPDSRNALSLLKLGNEFGIKFLNVNANLFQFVKISSLIKMYELPSSSADCILSFKNFNCLIPDLKLPVVEKISMAASEVNTMLDYSCVFNGPKAFPHLREVSILIDIGFTQPEPDKYRRAREFRDFHILLSHFFFDMEMILVADKENDDHVRIYSSVESLIIQFECLSRQTLLPEELPVKWISKAFPNLKKLQLVGWNTDNEGIYLSFWENFTHLEEVVLVNCHKINEKCFAGLENLNKLVRITVEGNGCIDEAVKVLFEDKLNFSPSEFLNIQKGNRTWIRTSVSC